VTKQANFEILRKNIRFGLQKFNNRRGKVEEIVKTFGMGNLLQKKRRKKGILC